MDCPLQHLRLTLGTCFCWNKLSSSEEGFWGREISQDLVFRAVPPPPLLKFLLRKEGLSQLDLKAVESVTESPGAKGTS